MAIELTSTSQATAKNGVKMLVYGLAGVGKTRLAATTGERTVIISAEAGLLSLAALDIPVIIVKTLADVHEAYQFLLSDPRAAAIKWIVIDSLSEIAEVLLADLKSHATDPRQAYGALSDKMGELIRAFRDLPGKDVVMIAKEERQKDERTGAFLYAPMMPGNKVGQNVPYFFDLVLAMRAEPDGVNPAVTKRALQSQRDYSYEAKDRSGKLMPFEAPHLGHIKSRVLGRPSPIAVQEEETPQSEPAAPAAEAVAAEAAAA